jgi:hypothetical protein
MLGNGVRLMRVAKSTLLLIVCYVALGLCARAQDAQASASTNDTVADAMSGDPIRSASFCMAFWGEIARQAINTNNALLLQRARDETAPLNDEILVRSFRAGPTKLPPDLTALMNRGEQTAGKTLWEMAALGNQMELERARIIALRLPVEEKCSSVSVDALSYQDEAKRVRAKVTKRPKR